MEKELEKIGTIIRNHRIQKGLTQEELGQMVYVSKQAVSKWENGRTLPDIEMVRKLCVVLDMDKDEILGGSIKENKNNRKWLNVCIAVSIISILIASFFGLGGVDYIDRNTQSGVAYVSVFWNDELLSTDKYQINSKLKFEDHENGYQFDIDYGELKGTLYINDTYEIEFGFINTNDWHNIQIRLDIEIQNERLIGKQTITYETDNNVYQVIVTENATSSNKLSVFRKGV